jgi:hypothetical protein
MITWKFNELEIYFQSKAENLKRDMSKMAYANNIKQNSKITIINGPDNQFISTDNSSSNGDTATIPQPTISMDTKKVKTTKQETNELPSVPSDLDNVAVEPNTLESTSSHSNPSEFGDGIPS